MALAAGLIHFPPESAVNQYFGVKKSTPACPNQLLFFCSSNSTACILSKVAARRQEKNLHVLLIYHMIFVAVQDKKAIPPQCHPPVYPGDPCDTRGPERGVSVGCPDKPGNDSGGEAMIAPPHCHPPACPGDPCPTRGPVRGCGLPG